MNNTQKIINAMNNIKTFAHLLSLYGVEIPLIQRDYVQGRVHDTTKYEGKGDATSQDLLKKYTRERERRNGFVRQLVEALVENPSQHTMHLTFIYGTKSRTSTNKNDHDYSLVPLDGQQRLTTLFLLTWLLIHKQTDAAKEVLKNNQKYQDLMKGMRCFSYKTRPSSDSFCSCLVNESFTNIQDNQDNSISEQIKEQSWFGKEWLLDPSVQAMLQMLDEIEQQIKDKDVQIMLQNLIDNKGIEFDLLDMKDYKLSDALYIKMNARGKQLTDFENWKADFIDFLETKHANVQYDEKLIDEGILKSVFDDKAPTLKKYFIYSIEHQWTDLFWIYCKQEIEINLNTYPVIDKYFMNVFDEITRIFFFVDNKDKTDAKDYEPSKEVRDGIYSKPDNVINLFAFLDILCKLDDVWFNNLFYLSANQDNIQDNKVRLFGDGSSTNLLMRCAKKENDTAITNTLLYAILCYAKKNGENINAQFKQFLRDVRNEIFSKAWLNGQNANMVDDYGINDIQSKGIYNIIQNELNGTKTITPINEYAAAIEDFDFIRGNSKIAFSSGSINDQYDMLKEWDSMDEHDKAALLVVYGFTGHFVKWCSYGGLWYFGRQNAWRPIFVHNDGYGNGNINVVMNNIMNDYLSTRDLKKMLAAKKTHIKASGTFDFKYYVATYDAFLNVYKYFAGKIDDLDLAAVQCRPSPMAAYHSDPIVYSVAKELETANAQGSKYLAYFTTGAERPVISIFDTPNADNPIAIFRHKSGVHENGAGVHENGGWEELDVATCNVVKNYPDNLNCDRVQHGVNIIKNKYPNDIFARK